MEEVPQRFGLPSCGDGGLTIVPMPGFERRARALASLIHEKSKREGQLETPVDVKIPKFHLRPSGEPWLELGKRHIGGHDVFVLASGPGTYEMTGQLELLLGYLAGHKARRITIVFGYMPQGRSDKDEHKVFALPPIYVTKWLAVSQGLLRNIIVVDPHSTQSTMVGHVGLVKPVWLTHRLLTMVYTEARALEERVILGFPDNSAIDRFLPAIDQIEKDFGERPLCVTVAAHRVNQDQKQLGGVTVATDIFRGARITLVDDEIAKGTTMLGAARMFRGFGAIDVWSAATHGVLCAGAGKIFAAEDCPVSRVYITDTIPPESRRALSALKRSGRLHVFSWLEDMGWVIYEEHWNNNVRVVRGIENPPDDDDE